jgi:hypothetical protein
MNYFVSYKSIFEAYYLLEKVPEKLYDIIKLLKKITRVVIILEKISF